MSDKAKTEIIIISGDEVYNITETALIQDWRRLGYIPEDDKLLDWRNFLSSTQTTDKSEYDHIQKEIKAVDYLLNQKYGKQGKQINLKIS